MASSANSYSIEIHPFISNSLAFSYLGPMQWPHQFLKSGTPRIQTPTNCNFPKWFHHFVLCDFIIKKKKNRESPLSIKNKTNLRGQYEEFHKLKKKKRKKYNSRTEKQKTHRLRKQISNSHDPISIERREKKIQENFVPLSVSFSTSRVLSVRLFVCLFVSCFEGEWNEVLWSSFYSFSSMGGGMTRGGLRTVDGERDCDVAVSGSGDLVLSSPIYSLREVRTEKKTIRRGFTRAFCVECGRFGSSRGQMKLCSSLVFIDSAVLLHVTPCCFWQLLILVVFFFFVF